MLVSDVQHVHVPILLQVLSRIGYYRIMRVPVLCRRASLVIYLIYSRVCMLITNS